MGKKQKRNRRSTSAPQASTNATPTTNNPIHNHKLEINKSRCRSSKKIKKLFDQLRNESQSLSSISLDTSNTVIELSEHNLNNNVMVTPVKIKTSTPEQSLIIIKDEDELITNNRPCTAPISPRSDLNSSPMHCSTPIAPRTNTVLREINPTLASKARNGELLQTLNNQMVNLTRDINKEDYLTIDLTEDSTLNGTNFNKSHVNTVIDLANTTDHDCAQISPNSSVSMSGDSDVTVLQNRKVTNGKQMKKFVNGIAKLSSTERGKLLEIIAQKVFTGTNSANNSLPSVKSMRNCATVTEEDAYIKEVILGQAPSRNSIGSNIYNPERDIRNKSGLRMIVIDGSNVAMQHSQGRVFSVKGLKICIDYFVRRGHIVKAFVPRFRCKLGKSTDGKLLDSLERQGLVVYTPSREVQGRLINSYDDRYIVQCAAEFDAVIVSGDNYRDLMQENPRWRFVIENRLLQFTWVGDMIMFPKDPLGRTGPTLEQFLRHPIVEQHPQVL